MKRANSFWLPVVALFACAWLLGHQLVQTMDAMDVRGLASDTGEGLASFRNLVRVSLFGLALVGALGMAWSQRAVAQVRAPKVSGGSVQGAGPPGHTAAEDLSSRGHLDGSSEGSGLEYSDSIRAELEEQAAKDAILASMAEGVLAVDREQRIMEMNLAAQELLKTADEDSRGKLLLEVARVPALIRTVEACLLQDRFLTSEVEIGNLDEILSLQLAAAPLRVGTQLMGCVLVLHDVTELRRLEGVRRDFVANVSHELKTPLTAIRGFLETILDDPEMPPEMRSSFLEKAERNTHRLGEIVSELLELARVQDKQEPMAMLPVHLNEVARECVMELMGTAEARGVELRMDFAESAPIVLGERRDIATAIRNLVSNAIKYSPEGEEVVIRISRAGRGSAGFKSEFMAVLLSVIDRGPGIPLSEQGRVFERFYRVDKDRSRNRGGTGLGLSIVRNIMIALGGDVSLESSSGQGCHFHLRFQESEAEPLK